MFNSDIIIAAVIIALLVVIAVIIFIINKSKKNSEPEASILDVEEVGVPSTSEANDFSYGYEKEETIVMDAIDVNKDETKEEENNNEE